MNVSCGSCPAKYAIPDDKVRGRKVRITCKRCGASIVVDGTTTGQNTTAPPARADTTAAAAAAASRRRGMKQTMIGIAPISPGAAPAPAPLPSAGGGGSAGARANADPPTPMVGSVHSTKRTIVGGIEAPRFGIATPLGQAAVRPPEASSPQSSAPEWTVAITDDQHEEMSTAEVVELFAAGTINEETFIWKEGMEDWKTPLEIPVIADRIEARGLRVRSAPRGSQPGGRKFGFDGLAARAPIEKQGPGTPMGVWREPGSAGWGDMPGWSDPDAASGDVSFDDVTVAMAAPQAEELLRAATADAMGTSQRGTPEERGPFSAEGALLSDPNAETRAYNIAALTAPSSPPGDGGFETPMGIRAALPAEAMARPFADEREERAARRDSSADRDQDKDLFADLERAGAEPETRPEPTSEPPSQPRLTGARNESSVLFSLDAMITKDESDADKPERSESEEDILGLSGATTDAGREAEQPLTDAVPPGSSGLLEPPAEGQAAASGESRPSAAPAIAPALRSEPPEPEPKGHGIMWAVVLLTLALLGAGGALLLTRPKSIFGGEEPVPSAAPAADEVTQVPPAPAPPLPAPATATAATEPTAIAPATDAGSQAATAAAADATAAALGAEDAGALPRAVPRVTQKPRRPVVAPAPAADAAAAAPSVKDTEPVPSEAPSP
jgi:predicted Zn finger-like uncharacterized protein